MSLHRFTRVGYYDFKTGDKLWEGFPEWEDHAVGFYEMELIIDRYEYGKMPSVYPKTPTYRHKAGFLPCTFGLAASQGVSFLEIAADNVSSKILLALLRPLHVELK